MSFKIVLPSQELNASNRKNWTLFAGFTYSSAIEIADSNAAVVVVALRYKKLPH